MPSKPDLILVDVDEYVLSESVTSVLVVATSKAKTSETKPKPSKSVSEDISNEANCDYHQRERVVYGNNYTRLNYSHSTQKAHPSAHMNIAPRAVLMKTGLRPLNIVRPVNTAHSKTTVYSARPMNLMEDMLPLGEEPKDEKITGKGTLKTDTEESIGAGHASKETGSSKDYVLMSLWKDGSLFDSYSKEC
nr:hypothetical protein [Tanacetum cinerariifolium]